MQSSAGGGGGGAVASAAAAAAAAAEAAESAAVTRAEERPGIWWIFLFATTDQANTLIGYSQHPIELLVAKRQADGRMWRCEQAMGPFATRRRARALAARWRQVSGSGPVKGLESRRRRGWALRDILRKVRPLDFFEDDQRGPGCTSPPRPLAAAATGTDAAATAAAASAPD